MKRTIEHTELFKELITLEPEYYYRTMPKEYYNEIRVKWKALLNKHGIDFTPNSYHYNRKKNLVELRSAMKDIVCVTKSQSLFTLEMKNG